MMWQSYSNGLLVAIGLIMAIGAQNAFVLAQSLRREHHLPVAALCIVCDALLVAAGVFGLATLLAQSPTLLAIARWGGAAFLIWYGSQALLRAAHPQSLQAAGSEPRSLRTVMLAALAVTLLNPHVYLDTVILLGALANQHGDQGRWQFGAGAVLASLTWFFLLAYGARALRPLFASPLAWRVLDGSIAIVMWTIALGLTQTP